LTEDEESPIQVPSEIYDIYKNQMKERPDYQNLQLYLFASANLYGVCSYNQLHKLYTHHTGSAHSLSSIHDYVITFAKKRQKLNANEDYFYHQILKVEDLVPLINSDIESYYFPTQDDINAYSTQLFGQEANELYDEIKECLLTKTKIEETLTGMLIGYEDALEEDAIDILFDYEEILDHLPYCLKMGKDLKHFIQKLDQLSIRFNEDDARDKANSLYLQALENTRKWPLKGALGSELKG